MHSSQGQMEGLSIVVIFILAILKGAETSQSCSIDIAEGSFNNRTAQYNDALNDVDNGPKLRELCLTQIRPDTTEKNFEDAIQLCTNAEVDLIQEKWFELNQNITMMCQSDCPDLMTLPQCKNMTYLEEIEFSKYERFCESFNRSYACAVNALDDCQFGITLYGAITEPIVISYWTYICNSGCGNIDETVAAITTCLAPLKGVKRSETCMAHYQFKDCIRKSRESIMICDEYIKLVRFIYRSYNKVDRYCTTTTTVTTTPIPVTTTPIPETTTPIPETTSDFKETPEITESISTVTLPFMNDVKEVRYETEPTSTQLVSTSDLSEEIDINIDDCLSVEDLEIIGADEISLSSVAVFLKLEACLVNVTQDSDMVERIRALLPSEIQLFNSRIKSEAWLVAQQALQEQAGCKEKNNASKEDCSGHGYGMISCNSGEIQASNVLVLCLCLLLPKFICNSTN